MVCVDLAVFLQQRGAQLVHPEESVWCEQEPPSQCHSPPHPRLHVLQRHLWIPQGTHSQGFSRRKRNSLEYLLSLNLQMFYQVEFHRE